MVILSALLLGLQGQKISAEFDLTPVPVVIQSLAKSSGQKLLASNAFKDRKLTIFAKDQTLEATMDAIAAALDAKWYTNSDGSKTLTVDGDLEQKAKSYVALEERLTRESTVRELKKMLDLARKMPEPEIKPNGRSGPGVEGNTVNIQRQGGMTQDQSLKLYPVQWKAMAKLPGTTIDSMIRGKIVVLSGNHGNALHKIIRQFDSSGSRADDEQGIVAFAWLNYDRGAIDVRTFIPTKDGSMSSRFSLTIMTTDAQKLRGDELDVHPFAAHLRPYQDGYMGSALKIEKKDFLPRFGPDKWTLSDHLKYVYLTTGQPVVAEAFRRPSRFQGPPPASDLPGYLNALSNKTSGWFKNQQGFVVAKQPEYWQLRPMEIPESVLLPIEAEATKRQLLLEDYANFLGNLNDDQLEGLDARRLISSLDIEELPPDIQSLLRFYGSLSQAQRTSLVKDGVLATGMLSQQVNFANYAIRSGIQNNGQPSGTFFGVLDQFTIWPDSPLAVNCKISTSIASFITMDQDGDGPPRRKEGVKPVTTFDFHFDDKGSFTIGADFALNLVEVKKVLDFIKQREAEKAKIGS